MIDVCVCACLLGVVGCFGALSTTSSILTNSQCNGQPSNSNNNSNNNVNLEQLITTQNQLMQAVLQTLNNMQPSQQVHQQ
jgi:hypothetical protein